MIVRGRCISVQWRVKVQKGSGSKEHPGISEQTSSAKKASAETSYSMWAA